MALRRIILFSLGALLMLPAIPLAGSTLTASSAQGQRPAEKRQKQVTQHNGRWMAGDFHQHTLYTDGSFSINEVISKGFHFGLDWQANSEHGGTSRWNEDKIYWDDPSLGVLFLGDPTFSDGHRLMWRWQNLRDYAYPKILALRAAYPDKLIASGLEWNIPGHEHCLVGIISSDGQAISDFEYMFDHQDQDTSRGLPKRNGSGSPLQILCSREHGHRDAVAAAAWLQANYPHTSWLIPAHPERLRSYDIAHFRDLNNAAPDVAFGFEGIPGHQKAAIRGDYSIQSDGDGTYGGAGWYTAQVGGLWDALLGEGRVWSVFANSDFHNTTRGFWPGEYARNYTFVQDRNDDNRYSLEELVDGLRSGNSFCVLGDLIDGLDFNLQGRGGLAFMGQTLKAAQGDRLLVTIRFRSPAFNHHNDPVRVDHIDLIAGDVTGRIDPQDRSAYCRATNRSARVIARFSKSDWKEDKTGWKTIEYSLDNIDKDRYFRLRGTNLGLGITDKTDEEGNPLRDSLRDLSSNSPEDAWADLWFYSNAIFVDVHAASGFPPS
ncbi:MAG: hypothetical protein AB1611_15080 [bacterium]